MKANIVLIGFMGAGKTSVAKLLARKLEMKVISSDQEIVKKTGKSIATIFTVEGEKYFRELEKQIIAKISQRNNCIIDCGGGVVLNEQNTALLKEKGTVVYLETSPEEIYERLKSETQRPLLNTAEPKQQIKKLLKDRRGLYEKAADATIMTDGKSLQMIVEEIEQFLARRSHE